jgi:putative membrane protein
MKIVANVLVSFLLLEHVYIYVIEVFFWNTPFGHRTFMLTPEFAAASQALAVNQGVYNGFLAAGLLWGFLTSEKKQALQIKLFFTSCIFIAGIVGGATALPKIYFIQALPALLTIIALVASNWTKNQSLNKDFESENLAL